MVGQNDRTQQNRVEQHVTTFFGAEKNLQNQSKSHVFYIDEEETTSTTTKAAYS